MIIRLFTVALLVLFCGPTLAQAAPRDEQVYNYSSILHAYWKLASPNNYEIFVKSYGQEFPEFASDDAAEAIKAISKNVEEADLDQTIVVPIRLEVGPYIQAKKAFVFKPFTADISIPSGPKTIGGNLPSPFVRFINGSKLRSIPMEEESAQKIPGYKSQASLFAEVRFLPKKASLTSRELKGQIMEIKLFDDRGAESVLLTFDEGSGDLKEAAYLGE